MATPPVIIIQAQWKMENPVLGVQLFPAIRREGRELHPTMHSTCLFHPLYAFVLSALVRPLGRFVSALTFFLVAALCAVAQPAAATVVSVAATSNIYGAGLPTPPNPGGGSAGDLPPSVTFQAAPGQVLTFSSVTGTSTLTTAFGMFPPDGNQNYPMNMSPYGAISGIQSDASSFLVGVFLDAAAINAAAPATLDFTASRLGTSFATLSPLLGQMFYIGDGLTGHGTGTVQQFNVPADATMLYLGFPDGTNYQGMPGQYQDNGGTLVTTFTINTVPEPSTWTLLGLGAVGAGVVLLRRRQRALIP